LARCQVELGYLDFRTGALDTALEWYASARSALPERGDPLLGARIDQVSGLVHYMRGNLDEAEHAFRASYEGYERAGDVALAVSALYNLGMVYEETGAMTRATDTFKEIRTRAHRIGDAENEARAAATWGWLLQRQGRGEEAVAELMRARDHFYERGNDATGLQVHLNAVVALARYDRATEATAEWDAATVVAERVESTPYLAALRDLTLGELRLRDGRGVEALPLLTEAERRFDEQALRQEAMESALLLAETHLALRDEPACLAVLDRASSIAETLADPSWSVLVAFLRAAARRDSVALRASSDDMEERNLQSYGARVLATVRAHVS
jgi:tetratricopeptide (TPR) repeat protein